MMEIHVTDKVVQNQAFLNFCSPFVVNKVQTTFCSSTSKSLMSLAVDTMNLLDQVLVVNQGFGISPITHLLPYFHNFSSFFFEKC